MIDPTDPLFLEQVRKSHCSHPDRANGAHGCAGTVTIGPAGYQLSCQLCGDAEERLAPDEHRWSTYVAQAVLRAAGIEWEALSPAAQRAAAEAARVSWCPGCATQHGLRDEHDSARRNIYCLCGYVWESWSGRWARPQRTA